MKTILLIRHGQTATQNGTFCGRTDIALSDIGRKQSHDIIQDLVEQGIELVITTGLQRTDYAGELAAKQGLLHLVEPNFAEVNFGAWEGLTWGEITTQYPVEARQWLRDPATMRFPDGEYMPDYTKRLVRAWQLLAAHPEQHIALIGHSGALAQLLHRVQKTDQWRYLQYGESVTLHI